MRQASARGEKQRLRTEAAKIVREMTPEARAEASRIIAQKVLALDAWQRAKTVMAYVSLPEEPDTRPLLEAALAEGKTLLLPRCLDRQRMVAIEITDLNKLEPDYMGIPAPPMPESGESAPAAAMPESLRTASGSVPPAEAGRLPGPDLILTPCVAVSASGVRLGHGAGYYDRFLADCGGTRVCLCFRPLLRAMIPAEADDVPVDLVITEAQEEV